MGAFMLDELRIALQRIDYLNGTVPSLRSRIDDDFWPAINDERPRLLTGFLNCIKPPILCLKDQDPSARMNQNEVRVRLFWPNRNIVPKLAVAIELCTSRSANRRSPCVIRPAHAPIVGISSATLFSSLWMRIS